jgi:hypothetical protein
MLYWVGVFRPSRFLVSVCAFIGLVAAILIHLEVLASPLEAVIVALLLGFGVVTFRAFWDHVTEDCFEQNGQNESVVEFMSFSHLAVSVVLNVLCVALVAARGRADHHWAQVSTIVCLLSMLYMACAGGHIYDALVHHNYEQENAAVELVIIYDTWFPLAMNLLLLARLAGAQAFFLQRIVWEPFAFAERVLEWTTLLTQRQLQFQLGRNFFRRLLQQSAHASSQQIMRALEVVMRAARQGDFHLALHVGCIVAGFLLTSVYIVAVLPVLARCHGKFAAASAEEARLAGALKTPAGALTPAKAASTARTPATTTTARKSRPRVPTPMTLRRKNLRSQSVRRGLQF